MSFGLGFARGTSVGDFGGDRLFMAKPSILRSQAFSSLPATWVFPAPVELKLNEFKRGLCDSGLALDLKARRHELVEG